jgi:hypothetical protein
MIIMRSGWDMSLRIDCLHGYFIFSESLSGQMSRFMSLFNFQISRNKDHYTFLNLLDAKKYALIGGVYLDAPITKTYEGEPWEIMRENDLIYDFSRGRLVNINTITTRVSGQRSSNYFLFDGLILPGSIMDDGSRVRDYSAWYNFERSSFRYSEVKSE